MNSPRMHPDPPARLKQLRSLLGSRLLLEVLSMRRKCWLIALALMLFPVVSQAIQLRWSSGATDLSFTSAARCTLIVRADPQEGTLPSEWRLLWGTTGCTIQPVILGLPDGSAAEVCGFAPPATPAEAAANQSTAQFCVPGNGAALTAHYVVDLPAGARGKLKVVAFDPADPDSSHVIQSPEVTFNGGETDAYPPVILRAERSHPSTQLTVRAIGAGLAAVPSVSIAAPDASWHLALDIVNHDDGTLTATGRVAADLPSCVLQVAAASGSVSTAALAPDTASALSIPPGVCYGSMKEIDLSGLTDIQPKDFAFVCARDSFHLFYIRHDMYLPTAQTEKTIGHQRSRDLNTWDPDHIDKTALQAGRGGSWDAYHVWAPSIVLKGITYYMFYTGADSVDVGGGQIVHNQRIGVATSTDLNIWHQPATPLLSCAQIPWAAQSPAGFDGDQFRDPYVMPDPSNYGQWLMYFVAVGDTIQPHMAVGVARSPGNLYNWTADAEALWNTDWRYTGSSLVESPHVFPDNFGWWWLFYSIDPLTTGFVCFQTNDSSPVDPVPTNWSSQQLLYQYLGNDQTVYYWHGSEARRFNDKAQYLCAWDDDQHSIDISRVHS